MRKKKPEVKDVVERFEAWRAGRDSRLIPEELWALAVGLLDRYSPSTICRELRLNMTRFKEEREARGVVVGLKRPRGTGTVTERTQRRTSLPETAPLERRARNRFIELPRLDVGVRGSVIAGIQGDDGRRGFRLTVESSKGALSVVAESGERGLVEALCQFVVGAFTDGQQR